MKLIINSFQTAARSALFAPFSSWIFTTIRCRPSPRNPSPLSSSWPPSIWAETPSNGCPRAYSRWVVRRLIFDLCWSLLESSLIVNLWSLISLQSLPKLFWVDLSGNELTTFDKGTFAKRISNLLLGGGGDLWSRYLVWVICCLIPVVCSFTSRWSRWSLPRLVYSLISDLLQTIRWAATRPSIGSCSGSSWIESGEKEGRGTVGTVAIAPGYCIFLLTVVYKGCFGNPSSFHEAREL